MIRRPAKRSRLGFTLIELMIVIVIIGILIALLLPVIIGAVRRANEGRVTADIQTIAMGLAKYKERYGEYPPSRIILSEQGLYTTATTTPNTNGTAIGPVQADFGTAISAVGSNLWINATGPAIVGSPDISFGELASRSLRVLRKMFPRAALGPEANTQYFPDFNGNNALDAGFIYLEGHECLCFFLGGIPNPTVGSNGSRSFGMSGFGKEPRYPFKNPGVVPGPVSTASRENPSYEFRGDRLVDPDGDGIPGYLDTNSSNGVGSFYAYFSAYGSNGYDPNDVNFGEDGDATIGATFRTTLPTFPATANPANQVNTPFSATPNPYTSSVPWPTSANQPASYVNSNSFQIISAGADGLFGPGGQWSSSGSRLPVPQPGTNGLRDTESDNLSNFTNGRLNP